MSVIFFTQSADRHSKCCHSWCVNKACLNTTRCGVRNGVEGEKRKLKD